MDVENQLSLIDELYPLQRDIVSEGYDCAMDLLVTRYGVDVSEYPSGARCLDWTVPPGWECSHASIESGSGETLLDKRESPLCVASYSTCFDGVLDRQSLLKKIILNRQLADEPPFLFYYYDRQWMFGGGYQFPEKLKEDHYRVRIDSRFYQSTLKVGEIFLPGESDEEFIFSTHLCHPHQVNDGLSGVVTGLALMEWLSGKSRRRYSYRLLIGPETIGSVCWLSRNQHRVDKVRGGLFLEMTGLDQRPALQRSYSGNSSIDQVLEESFRDFDHEGWVSKYRGVIGNDERQFNGPGFRIPMLSYSRAHPWGHPERPFREYHSTKDNPDLVSSDAMAHSMKHIQSMIEAMEGEYSPSAHFKGEAFLSGLGLALDRNAHLEVMRNRMKIMDMLDGTQSISSISRKLHLPMEPVSAFIHALAESGAIQLTDSNHQTMDANLNPETTILSPSHQQRFTCTQA